MEKVPFDPKELEPIGYSPAPLWFMPPTPIFNSPITRKENFLNIIHGEDALWMPHTKEFMIWNPSCIPDSWARGATTKPGPPIPQEMWGGPDMFGVEWEYVPQVGGSMVRPGKPHVADLEHWEDYVNFPDIEKWDWATAKKEYDELYDPNCIVKQVFFSGLFERLISFVDMTDAMLGLIDEDVQPAIHRLFDRLCGLYEKIIVKSRETFHPDIIWFHDDWGSQRAPFFSANTVSEMILPYLARCVEIVHNNGMRFEFHSCGKVEDLVPLMIEAGVDMWNGQPMNDKKKVLQTYGDKIVVDSCPPELPRDASHEEKVAAIRAYVEDFAGLRTPCRMTPQSVPDEYEILYEESRKIYGG